MNSHDWSTPLVQFKLNESLMSFWTSSDAVRLRNLIGIKPDKFKGNAIYSLSPKLKMPPEEGTKFDLVHCSSCWSPHLGEGE